MRKRGSFSAGSRGTEAGGGMWSSAGFVTKSKKFVLAHRRCHQSSKTVSLSTSHHSTTQLRLAIARSTCMYRSRPCQSRVVIPRFGRFAPSARWHDAPWPRHKVGQSRDNGVSRDRYEFIGIVLIGSMGLSIRIWGEKGDCSMKQDYGNGPGEATSRKLQRYDRT